MGSRCARRAFTLVELLVVIAIIGVLVALLLPAVQAAREAARRSECSNKLKQIGLALHNYHDTNKMFPPNAVKNSGVSWHVSILPFLENGPLYDEFNLANNWNATPNTPWAEQRQAPYLCPSGPEEMADDNDAHFTTHYYGLLGPTGTNPMTNEAYGEDTGGSHGGYSKHGLFHHQSGKSKGFRNMTDGASNTFAVGEISWGDRNNAETRYRAWSRGMINSDWSAPSKNMMHQINDDYTTLFNDMSFGSEHPGGAQFLLGDASVQFVSENIDFETLLSLASCDGGETAQLP